MLGIGIRPFALEGHHMGRKELRNNFVPSGTRFCPNKFSTHIRSLTGRVLIKSGGLAYLVRSELSFGLAVIEVHICRKCSVEARFQP